MTHLCYLEGKTMPTIVHFEIPANDMERAKRFYGELFGWKFEQHQGPVDYWMVSTTDEKGEAALCGGMIARQSPEHAPVNYIDVPSVDEHLARIEKAGGRIVTPKTPVPGIGYFAVCLDTENNAFGIWETNETAV